MYLDHSTDDATLLERVTRGDTEAFGTLVGRYERVLFAVAWRMLGDRAEAQDATQTAFVRAFEKRATFDGQHRFFSWIYRILLNECLNQRRRPVTSSLRVVPPITRDPAERLDRERRQRALREAIAGLTPEYRDVIVLRPFGECSYDQIAAAVGVPGATVKSRLYTARQRLAQALSGLGPP